MKRIIFMIFVLLCATAAVYAQNTSQLESQLNQLIQQNDAEYQRLVELRNTVGSEDWLNELQRTVNERQEQIATLQKQIEAMINDRAPLALSATKLRELEGLMQSHSKYLQAIEEHKKR